MTASIISIVGPSGVGKTTLIEGLIGQLVRNGYRVATVKHAHHGCDFDVEGKDTWRHKEAGAHTVIAVSGARLALFADIDAGIRMEALRDRFLDSSYDLILVEGFKSADYPKIVLVRDHLGEVVVSPENVIAVVTRQPVVTNAQTFHPTEVEAISQLIQERYPRSSSPGS
ncbi:MAG: molybdopterin-guanine dinucleotide biosynthesis protein B [Candidatus Eisenbacteria bacterium]|uniref:Molybdopterin-guanine dinucleotide biosynthesis protein B n=1 Tax=Eiseniibacteriota bacterium TaxID=2212470 RepID=A0A956LWI9_UNCEI|nr:molybdopterin-guanine dinucleotide biosynthesis protein B [Candidatus Eisenbacteria bacterium]